jgi:4-amino-4-deoxy-L-arabinose transferase-like glycosyltransferase
MNIKKLLKPTISSKISLLFLAIIVIAAGIVRGYKISTPLADWHSWRQSDTASVTREMINSEGTLFIPEYQDLSNVPSGQDNLEGYRMVELPLLNFFTAKAGQQLFGKDLNLVVFSRQVTVGLSLISIIALYFITLKLSQNRLTSLLTAASFAFLPYSVFYSRVILPEPAMVTFALLSILFFLTWLEAKKFKLGWYLASWTAMAVALLLKPTAIFFTPVLIVAAIYKHKTSVLKQPLLWLFLMTLAPLLAWRQWIEQFPTGIPASSWLFNGNGIRLKPAWWRWLFAERIAKLILGYWGVLLVSLGLIGKSDSKKISYFDSVTLAWAGGMVLYLITFATGNVQHDYYQILLIPILSLLFARGIVWLTTSKAINQFLAVPVIGIAIGLTLFLSWYEIRGYYNINNPAIVEAGQAVDQNTPENAVVIAPYGGDTAFLFQTNRRGWPIGFEIEDKIDKGATHYVTTTYDDEARDLEEFYATVVKNDQYLILDLTQQLKPRPKKPEATSTAL